MLVLTRLQEREERAHLVCPHHEEEALALLNALVRHSCRRQGRHLAALLIRMVGLCHSLRRHALLCIKTTLCSCGCQRHVINPLGKADWSRK